MIEVSFTKEQSVPDHFYVGLCEDADLVENAVLGDQTELVDDSGQDVGYSRFELASGAMDFTSAAGGVNDRVLTTATVSFTAAGSNWANAKTWFLATTDDDIGKLIASGPVNSGSGTALMNGQTLSFDIQITWP